MNLEKLFALVRKVLGLTNLPKKEGKLALSEDQKKLLEEVQEGFAANFEKLANEQFAKQEELNSTKESLKEAQTQLRQLLAANGPDGPHGEKEEGNKGKKNADGTAVTVEEKEIPEMISQLKEQITSMQSQIKKLSAEDEPDAPKMVIPKNGNMKIVHSATHLFASGKSYDAIDNRPWNKQALDITSGNHKGAVKSATNWNDKANIDQLASDLGDYFNTHRQEILDLMMSYTSIPAHWPRISNVSDRTTQVAILTGEITQSIKKKWLPKNNQKFVAIINKIFDVQIDAQWSGFELKKMERTWANMWNKEGSSPYKDRFVAYLLSKLIEQARREDEISYIKGVHFPTSDDETVPQSFIHRQDGFLKKVAENRGKTYLPFTDLGKPTNQNIVDYVKSMCESLPDEKKEMPGLYFYLSKDWMRKYYTRKKELDGMNQDYKPEERTVENFPNIKFEPLDYLNGSDFMCITVEDNIGTMTYVEAEENIITIEKRTRDIFAFGDYKSGIFVGAFGTQWEEGNPVDFKNQIFWSNNVELLTDTAIPVTPNDTTPSVKYHYALKMGENTQATAITTLDDAENGKYYYLYGNTGTAATIANAGNFDLSGAMTLEEGTMIKLYKRPGDGKFVEIYRRANMNSGADLIVLDVDATTADGSLGDHFITQANTQATALTDITNAEEGKTYRLEGGADGNATTIAKAGKFSRISAPITLEDGNYIDVVYSDGKFVELARQVA